jgi:hypothetical protein
MISCLKKGASGGRRQINMPDQTPGVVHGDEIRHRMPASRPCDSSNDNLPHRSENLAGYENYLHAIV